jgi:hypothetical protein
MTLLKMRNKQQLIAIIISVLLLGCYSSSWRNVSWSKKKVRLDEDIYAPIVVHYGKNIFTYCEFFDLFSQIRSDSLLFEQMFIVKNKDENEGGFSGTIQRITKIGSSESGTFAGWAYRKDSSFYSDVHKWGCKLECIPCDSLFRVNYMEKLRESDLSHDSAFVHRAIIRNGIELRRPLPPAKDFRMLESKW